jgi:hypothetical protein
MDRWAKAFVLSASVLSSLSNIGLVTAAPSIQPSHDEIVDSALPFPGYSPAAHKRQDEPGVVPLRILGLGASIMSGAGSTTGNGCRKPLRDALRLDGWEVDMVGSLVGGTMIDREHEAVAGDVLTQVLARVPNSIGYKASQILLKRMEVQR